MNNLSKYIALTGRVKTFLEDDSKTMPVSCTAYEYNNDLFECLKYISIALRGAAGVCVNLDKFKESDIEPRRTFAFYLPENHQDYKNNLELMEKYKKQKILLSEHELLEEDNIITVNDSMEEDDDGKLSIQNSWKKFIELLEEDKTPVVDLSYLRSKGITNKEGLVASGAISFLSIYELIFIHLFQKDLISLMQVLGGINDVLRRGGFFKNGIVTFSLNYNHPDIIKYLKIPLKNLPGSAKKAIIIDKHILNNKRLVGLLEIYVNDKSLMLEKTIHQVLNKKTNKIEYLFGITKQDIDLNIYSYIKKLMSQVCKEIIFSPKDTCLLLHSNLGQVTDYEDIVEAICEPMRFLCKIWLKWKDQVGYRSSQYNSIDVDRQVGLGLIGLANMLSFFEISFKDHVESMKAMLDETDKEYLEKGGNKDALHLAQQLRKAYLEAANIAQSYGLERAFTLAPTQTCAYNNKDTLGNTTCKNINPPLAKRTRRTSHTLDSMKKMYYHGDVETMQEFIASNDNNPYIIQTHWENYQRLMNLTGMAHCTSYDLYFKIDKYWLFNFFESPLVTTYYQVYDRVDQSYLNKAVAPIACDMVEGCVSCAE